MALLPISINVAGIIFKSDAELKRHLQSLLYSYDEWEYVNPSDCHFLLSALRRHPEAGRKIGVGVLQFQRRVNMSAGRGKAPGFWIIRVDGTEESFSIYALVGPSCRATPQDLFLNKIVISMRECIADRVAEAKERAFAEAKVITCPITGRALTRSETHVDHAGSYPFVRIQDEFLHAYGKHIRPSDINDDDLGCKFTNAGLRDHFLKFHERRAVLEVISSRANMSKGSSGYRATFNSSMLLLDDREAAA